MSSLSKYFVNYKYFNILKPPGWKINNGGKWFLLEKWSPCWFFHPKLTYRKDWADGDHQDDDHDEENDDDHHDACHHHEPEFQIQDAEPSLRHRRQIAGHWTRTMRKNTKKFQTDTDTIKKIWKVSKPRSFETEMSHSATWATRRPGKKPMEMQRQYKYFLTGYNRNYILQNNTNNTTSKSRQYNLHFPFTDELF